MKIVSFYYMDLPDDKPKDPFDAASEVYVEVGGEDATTERFDYTYAFRIYTLKNLARRIQEKEKGFLVDRSVIVVDRFDDSVIRSALESILHQMEFFGIRK